VSGTLRKLLLTAHVVASVGWAGAVLGFLGLALSSMLSSDSDLARGAYLSMELTGRYVLLPLALASLATGVAQSLATKWGLFHHYWVVIKLIINLIATLLLLIYMQTLAHLANRAREATSPAELDRLASFSPVLHAVLALVLLLVATTLGVYKPRGLTPIGQRKRRHARPG